MSTPVPADDSSYIVRLHQALLDRDPSDVELADYVNLLSSGRITRHGAALALARSPEFQGKLGKAALREDAFAGYAPADLEIFGAFRDPLVHARSGFVTDFVGSRVRLSSLWNGCETLENRVLGFPIPADYHADVLEWLGTLKAVMAAKDHLSVMELGAGYAPWLAASAAAARLRGINDMVLCGVEADPARFNMMKQNFEDNNLTDYDVILICAAVGVSDGMVRWPRLDDPRNNAGVRPFREGNVDDAAYLEGVVQLDELVDVEVVSFGRLLDRRAQWDLVHIDVQGTEVELCRACIEQISRQVRYMVVGTHSRKLDGDLMEIMNNAGWILEHERPTRLRFNPHPAPLIKMTSHDGTQVWRNPAL